MKRTIFVTSFRCSAVERLEDTQRWVPVLDAERPVNVPTETVGTRWKPRNFVPVLSGGTSGGHSALCACSGRRASG